MINFALSQVQQVKSDFEKTELVSFAVESDHGECDKRQGEDAATICDNNMEARCATSLQNTL